MNSYLDVILGEHCPLEFREDDDMRVGEFETILRGSLMGPIRSIAEFGSGMTAYALRAARNIYPEAHTTAIDVDEAAVDILRGSIDTVVVASVCDPTSAKYDLVLSAGLLSCLETNEDLSLAYETLVGATKRYLWVRDYYSSEPSELWHPHRTLVARNWQKELTASGDLQLEGCAPEDWWLFSRAS